MAHRPYRMDRREQAAEETRRRIVEATFALHLEQGIAATTMKQIAARAGVSVGAVYHHFPTYDDAIGGCASHVRAAFPFPNADAFGALPGLAERIAGYVQTLCRFYGAFPQAEAARLESGVSRHVARFFEEEQANRLALARMVFEGSPGVPPEAATTLAALTDVGVHGALVRAGRTSAEAAAVLAEVLTAWARTLTAADQTTETLQEAV